MMLPPLLLGAVKATLTCPLPGVATPMLGALGTPTTVTLYWRVPEKLLASLALMVKVKVPNALGVPLSRPWLLKLRPFGKLPLCTLN